MYKMLILYLAHNGIKILYIAWEFNDWVVIMQNDFLYLEISGLKILFSLFNDGRENSVKTYALICLTYQTIILK